MQYKNRVLSVAGAAALASLLAACGGGGGSGSSVPSTGGGTPTPTATPTIAPSYATRGTVVSIPQGAFGASASPQTPLSGATVVIGAAPVLGSTPPPSALSGDVIATTDGSGNFVAMLTQAAAAPTSAAPFMVPQTNVFNVTTPITGYYVTVFGAGADGKSAGAPIPFHGFLAVSSGSVGTIRVTTVSATEAAFLVDVNTFRASKGAGALAFDEIAEEAARQHAGDEGSAPIYYCHFDRQNVGPTSRYLKLGGLGLDAENIALILGVAPSPAPYVQADGEFEAEGPGGGHYDNLVNATRQWVGLAQFLGADGNNYVDQEIVTPNVGTYSTYTVFAGSSCPTGTTANGS